MCTRINHFRLRHQKNLLFLFDRGPCWVYLQPSVCFFLTFGGSATYTCPGVETPPSLTKVALIALNSAVDYNAVRRLVPSSTDDTLAWELLRASAGFTTWSKLHREGIITSCTRTWRKSLRWSCELSRTLIPWQKNCFSIKLSKADHPRKCVFDYARMGRFRSCDLDL